jgi:hypothetical protein
MTVHLAELPAKENDKVKRALLTTLLLLGFSAQAFAQAIILDPGVTLEAESGPFGYGGRGVVFRAEENFSMSSFGMDLAFDGSLDFAVSVYAVDGTSRGTLISETAYPGLTDDGSEFFTLAHSESFTAGTSYEIIMRYSDPGVRFPHYEFNNPTLNEANGFMAGTSILVLDGSDFDSSEFGNTWLARFQLDGDVGPTTPAAPTTPVPAMSPLGLVLLVGIMLMLATAVLRSRRRA